MGLEVRTWRGDVEGDTWPRTSSLVIFMLSTHLLCNNICSNKKGEDGQY